MKILFLNGEKSGSKYELVPACTTVGRETDNTLQLLEGGVSRYHAKIECKADGKWFITDLGSTNGTKVNGQKISGSVELHVGNVVAIGEQTFCFGGFDETDEKASARSAATARTSLFEFHPNETANEKPFENSFGVKNEAQLKVADKEDLFSSPAQGGEEEKKRPFGNVLFIILVVCLGIIAAAGFVISKDIKSSAESDAVSVKKTVSNPFELYYEKFSITPETVFKFTLNVKNDTVRVVLDDLRYHRHMDKEFKDVNPRAVTELARNIADAGFMSVRQEQLSGGIDNVRDSRRIVAVVNNKLNDVTVHGNVSSTFAETEKAISSFMYDELGLTTQTEKVEDILNEARNAFVLGEDYYRSYETVPENLPKAIAQYRMVSMRLEQFDPRPPEWKIASDRYKEAVAKLEKIKEDGEKSVTIYYQSEEYERAVAECDRLLRYFGPETETHKKIKSTKIKIEKLIK